MLQEFERWLRGINESAADSLLEALEEVLTLHRLKVPALLRKSLHSTNPIESMFSMVRSASAISNATVTARCASDGSPPCCCTANTVQTSQGYASIDVVVAAIDATQREDELPEAA